jgi:outer membrane protein
MDSPTPEQPHTTEPSPELTDSVYPRNNPEPTTEATPSRGLNAMQWAIIGLCALMLVGLFFAEHTPPLDNKKPESEAAAANKPAANTPPEKKPEPKDVDLDNLAAIKAPSPEMMALTKQLDGAKTEKDSLSALKGLVKASIELSRYDHAAIYQQLIHQVQPTDCTLIETATLFKDASNMYQALQQEDWQKIMSNKAIDYYQQYLAKFPDDRNAKVEQAILSVTTDNPMAGIQQLVKLVKEYPDDFKAVVELGLFSMQTQQYTKAIERFQQAVKYHPNRWEAQFYLAGAYEKAGDTAGAKAAYAKVKSMNIPKDIQGIVESKLKSL